MSTVVVSDLHLGDRMSLLETPHVRRRLLDELRQADRVVLLGDALELRHSPAPDVLAAARPFLEELGEALAGRRLVLVPGNHDHQIAGPLLQQRRLDGDGPLGLEWSAEPGEAGLAGAIASMLGGGPELTIAYPGIWLRDDVYATHGHYLDCHVTFPRMEAVLAALMRRMLGTPPEIGASPDDYEAALGPLYALAYGLGQASGRGGGYERFRRGIARRSWGWLKGSGRRPNPRRLALGALGYGALTAANHAGIGPFRPDLSIESLTRSGLTAMAEVVRGLGIDAPHVVFGHTHRAGPFGEEPGWELPRGGRLTNAGSWAYSPGLVGEPARRSPYWPGTCVWVGPSGPPELVGLLDGLRAVPAVT